MPIMSVLIFFGIFIAIVMIAIFAFVVSYNKRTNTILDKFTSQSESLNPIFFANTKIQYRTVNGGQIRVYPNNSCDLFLFESCLAIVRKQDFIFKVKFAPILLTSDITITKDTFNYLDVYKPNKILFKQKIKGEIDIELKDPIYKHYKIDITLKGLTKEQIDQLDKIKSWNS